ncbi:hypothetical protein MMC07_009001 [Pseudocyphellaria aurata]|nr:hypothetical protein [Pseudocyphellaria aurata]
MDFRSPGTIGEIVDHDWNDSQRLKPSWTYSWALDSGDAGGRATRADPAEDPKAQRF